MYFSKNICIIKGFIARAEFWGRMKSCYVLSTGSLFTPKLNCPLQLELGFSGISVLFSKLKLTSGYSSRKNCMKSLRFLTSYTIKCQTYEYFFV